MNFIIRLYGTINKEKNKKVNSQRKRKHFIFFNLKASNFFNRGFSMFKSPVPK